MTGDEIYIASSAATVGPYMNLAEVRVNGAAKLTATQSSTYVHHGQGLSAANCVDGNPDTMCHTNSGPFWFSAKLEEPTCIESIQVDNRNNCCQDRIKGSTIEVRNGGTQVWSSVFAEAVHKYAWNMADQSLLQSNMSNSEWLGECNPCKADGTTFDADAHKLCAKLVDKTTKEYVSGKGENRTDAMQKRRCEKLSAKPQVQDKCCVVTTTTTTTTATKEDEDEDATITTEEEEQPKGNICVQAGCKAGNGCCVINGKQVRQWGSPNLNFKKNCLKTNMYGKGKKNWCTQGRKVNNNL